MVEKKAGESSQDQETDCLTEGGNEIVSVTEAKDDDDELNRQLDKQTE